MTFTDGNTTLATVAISGGSASFTTAALSVGSHTIAAVYSGDSNYPATTNTVAQTVNKASTTTTLTSSANPSSYGGSVTFTATVTSGATGTVTFKDGSTTLGTGTISGGQATFTYVGLSVGSHSITAVYGGDTSYAGSTSPAITQTVTKASSSTTLTSSANPSNVGGSVTFTAIMNSMEATGTVTFMDGATTLGTGTLHFAAYNNAFSNLATFSTSALAAGSHSITAVYGGDTHFATSTSSAVSQTVNKASSTTELTSSTNDCWFGDSVTLTATVPGNATGTVTFIAHDTAQGTDTTLGTGTISGGTASFTSSSIPAALYTLTAVYGGDASYDGSTNTNQVLLGVAKAASTTSLTSSAATMTYGQNVTFTATVPSAATGTVTFYFNNQQFDVPVSGGSASYTTQILNAGSNDIAATYNGDNDYISSFAVMTQTVTQATTQCMLLGSVASSTYGDSVTFNALVTFGATGTVTFMDGTDTLGTGTLTEAGWAMDASFDTSALTAGSHTITAVYGGDTNFTPVSATVDLVVNQASSTTSLASSTTNCWYGDPVTFTATVPFGATGSVTFMDGVNTLGTGTINGGQATFSTSALTAGSHSITAVYGGDANYTGSTSSAVTQTVNQASSTTSVASSASTSTYGASVTFTATVTSDASGTVTFMDGTNTLGTGTISSGQATFTTVALTGGSHSITAVYGGDANYTGSTSSAITQTVSQASSTTSLASSANPTTAGTAVTFTATVTSGATGTVTFMDGSTTLFMATITGGQATFITSTLTAGSHSITAVYGGDTNYASSTSAAITQTVAAAPLVTSNPTGQTVNAGATATFTASAIGSPTPTVQWQVSTNGGTSWANISGATSTSYTTAATIASNEGNQYRAVFINSQGSAATTAATLHVNSAPVITSQPISVTTNANSTATFTAAAIGSPTPTVQWQKNTGSGWTNIQGATSASYTTPTLSAGDTGTQYRAVFTNTFGNATTNAATLTIATVAKVSGTAVGWGTQTANLVEAGNGRLLPAGRSTDIPWLGIKSITLTLDSAASLAVGDVTIKSAGGFTYSVASINGSGTTSVTINLGGAGLANADRVTVTVGNSSLASFSRRLDVLPGDVNDDGLVTSLDQLLVSRGLSGAYITFYDVDGNGSLTSNDVSLIKTRIGTKLPG